MGEGETMQDKIVVEVVLCGAVLFCVGLKCPECGARLVTRPFPTPAPKRASLTEP